MLLSSGLTLLEAVISTTYSLDLCGQLWLSSWNTAALEKHYYPWCELETNDRSATAASSHSHRSVYPPAAFVCFLTQGCSFLRQGLLRGEFLAVTFSWGMIGQAPRLGCSLIVVSETRRFRPLFNNQATGIQGRWWTKRRYEKKFCVRSISGCLKSKISPINFYF